MLYLLKQGSIKTFETRRGLAYNAQICNQNGVVIGTAENQGSGGSTDIWIEKEYRDQWFADLEAKGYESHHEENLAEWMFDVEEGLIKTAPTEIPTLKELMAWEDIKYSKSEIEALKKEAENDE